MVLTPNDCRREAELCEQAALRISLQPDKEELLATAQSLRRRADLMEGAIDRPASRAACETAPPPAKPPHQSMAKCLAPAIHASDNSMNSASFGD